MAHPDPLPSPPAKSRGGDLIAAGYIPHPAQAPFHRSSARFRNVGGGRQSGKTMACGAEFDVLLYRAARADPCMCEHPRRAHRPKCRQCDCASFVDAYVAAANVPIFKREPRRTFWVVSPIYTLSKRAFRYVWAFLPLSERLAISKGVTAGWNGEDRALWLTGDTMVRMRTADDPKSLVAESLAGLWLNEAARIPSEAWENLQPAIGRTAAWVITDSTPLGHNWYWEAFWRRGQAGDPAYSPAYANFLIRSEDSPYYDRAELARLREVTPPRIFKREHEGDFGAFGGQIFDMLDDRLHVFDPPSFDPREFRRVIAGVDFGYAAAGAVTVIGERGGGLFEVLAEDYASGRSNPAWLDAYKRLRQAWGIRSFYADPSRPDLIQEMRRVGLTTIGADNDVTAGIALMSTLLHQRRLRIARTCPNLLREMRSYRWRESPTQGRMEEPASGQSDHSVDAARYCLISAHRPPSLRAL